MGIFSKILKKLEYYHFSYFKPVTRSDIIVCIILALVIISLFMVGAFFENKTVKNGEDVIIYITDKWIDKNSKNPSLQYGISFFIECDSTLSIQRDYIKRSLYDSIRVGNRYKAKHIKGSKTVYPFWDSLCPPINKMN